MVGIRRCRHVGPRQVVADDVGGRDVGQHRDAQTASPVLVHGNDRGGGRPAFGHHVKNKFDRGADNDGAGEHSVCRPYRLVGESLRHRHNRLREHLGAFDDLPLVLAGDAGLAGEPVGPVSLRVEQFQQAVDRPLSLIGIRGQIRLTLRY